MKVKYELDQRTSSGIQVNLDGKKFTFSPKLGDKKTVRTMEATPKLDGAVKSGYLIKHIGDDKVLTKDGELSYAEYKKQLKKLNKKAPKPVKKQTAVKKAKDNAKAEEEESKAKAKAEEEAKAKAKAEEEAKAEADKKSKKKKK